MAGNLRMHSKASDGAEGGTRTPTILLPPAPQAGASANSATSASGVRRLGPDSLTTTFLVLEPAWSQVLLAPRAEPLQVLPEPLVSHQAPSRVRSGERCYPAPTTRCHRADP